MIWTKSKGMALVAMLICLGIYHAIVFVLPFNMGSNFWVGYGFSVFAIILSGLVWFYVFDKDSMMSKFYNIPLIGVVKRYLIFTLIIGFIMMILGLNVVPINISWHYGFVFNTIVLGFCLLGLITVKATVDTIESIDVKIKEKVVYIRSLQADVESLVDKVSEESVRKALKELAETIQYSVKMSSPQLASIENKIEGKVMQLGEVVENGDEENILSSCDELQKLLAERNRKCKLLK